MNGSVQQLFGQGARHHQAGQLREAESIYRQILTQHPNHADALHMLGILGHQIGRGDEGVELIRRAIALNPQSADYHANLGAVLAGLGKHDAAAAEFRAALALRPNSPEIQNNLGKTLRELGQLDEAIEAFKQAIGIRTNLAEAHHQLGDLLRDTGQLDRALASYRRAMALVPDSRFGSSFVHAIHLHPDYSSKRIYEAHLRWNQTYAESFGSSIPMHVNDPAPDRRLRIGYVWSDKSERFLPLITNHDRSQFDVLCYANRSDETVRPHCDVWRDISSLNDQQAMELIAQDQIDVLVDLNMHTPRNRLLLFARKPAPIQFTGLAYPSTTGLTTMDYRVSDPALDGDGNSEDFHSDQTLTLPKSLFLFQPPAASLSVNELPAKSNGFTTFGCLGSFAKVSSRAISFFVNVLKQVEKSRLLMVAPRGSSRERKFELLHEQGIDRSRIEFIDRSDDLSVFHRIDLCLDTFPWNGCTTTFNALWMGVPVLSLAGETAVSRIGKSILGALGLKQWIADSDESLIVAAIDATRDLPSLAEIRFGLRERLVSSPLTNADRFAKNVESLYRQAWRNWCHRQSSANVVANR